MNYLEGLDRGKLKVAVSMFLVTLGVVGLVSHIDDVDDLVRTLKADVA